MALRIVPFVDDDGVGRQPQVGMELRAPGPLHTVRRPRAAVLLEMARLLRMPIARRIHGDRACACIREVSIHRRNDFVPAGSCERATRAEILLYVHDEQRRLAVLRHCAVLRNHRSSITCRVNACERSSVRPTAFTIGTSGFGVGAEGVCAACISDSYGCKAARLKRPRAPISVRAANMPDSTAGPMPSPLSGYARPAASPTMSMPLATSGLTPAPRAWYA